MIVLDLKEACDILRKHLFLKYDEENIETWFSIYIFILPAFMRQ